MPSARKKLSDIQPGELFTTEHTGDAVFMRTNLGHNGSVDVLPVGLCVETNGAIRYLGALTFLAPTDLVWTYHENVTISATVKVTPDLSRLTAAARLHLHEMLSAMVDEAEINNETTVAQVLALLKP